MGSKKGLPALAAARPQRWALLLLGYQYDLEFRSTGQHANSNGLSCLPTDHPRTGEEVGATAFNIQQIELLPVRAQDIQAATRADPQLSQVL